MSIVLKKLTGFLDALNRLNEPFYSNTYEEIKSMSILERCKLYNFNFEIGSIILMVVLVALYGLGKNTNVTIANKIYNYFNEWLTTQFSTVGFLKTGVKVPYVAENSNTFFTTFATGRAYIANITIKTELLPKHNPAIIVMEKLLKYFFPAVFTDLTVENMEIIIKPNNISLNGSSDLKNELLPMSKFSMVASIVSKSCMGKSRESNYFLSTTQTVESPNLPQEYVYMSEMNQLNAIFKKTTGLGKDLSGLLKKSRNFLNYIAFTDLPVEKPITDEDWINGLEPRCIISTKITSDPKDLELITQLCEFVFIVYENLTQVENTGILFNGDVSKKIKTSRQQELNKILKNMKELASELAKDKKLEETRKTNPEAERALREKRERRKKIRQQKASM